MIIVRINGGLGNQIFQYATGRYLSIKNNTELVLDVSEFDKYKLRNIEIDKYNIQYTIAANENVSKMIRMNPSSFLMKVLKKLKLYKFIPSYYLEPHFNFDSKLLDVKDNTYIEGYFQSEKYFYKIRDILLEDLKIKENLSSYCKRLKKEIHDTANSISVHFRRGDYVSSKIANSVHGVLPLEYYQKAIEYFEKKYERNTFFIFSDDIDWVKENFHQENLVYIQSEETRIAHEDIYLMSLCQHNIIANSSFSWWGAWLNQNEDQEVISPNNWFNGMKNTKDLYCNNWIII